VNIVFFGTSAFAAQLLAFLLEKGVQIAAIVTQPDRPQGRKLQLMAPAVKLVAQLLCSKIPVLQPEKASNPLFLEELSKFQADLYVVVAYGQILSRALLAMPPLGCINIHASLLPHYRGAAPIQRALMNGDSFTGISIQKMVYQLDAGDVIDEVRVPIGPDLTFGELEQILCDAAKPLLYAVLQKYELGVPSAKEQNHEQVTYAAKILPQETEIQWNEDANVLHNRIRALSPRPGAWCWIEQNGERKRLKLLRSHPVERNGLSGELLAFGGRTCVVAAAKGALELQVVQPEGKKSMLVDDWIRGCQSNHPIFES
jgi:methionyl-tRNA formyltransferase